MPVDRFIKLLMVEDSEDDVELAVDHLEQSNFTVQWKRVQNADSLSAALNEGPWRLILSDFLMPGFTGLDALAIVREHDRDVPFIIISGSIGEDLAVQAMRAGAQDYLMKGSLTRLGAAVERELREADVRRDRRRVEAENVRQAEELRQQAKELARTNLELERFAYLAAHDLQEPLRVVSTYAELLVRRYASSQDEEVQRIVNFITGGVDRMETLISGLLSYSSTLVPNPVDLQPLDLQAVAMRARDSLLDRLERVEGTIFVEPMPRAIGDESKLDTIFTHLFTNAIKFRQPDVALNVLVEARTSADAVEVTVSDNGIGIEPAFIEQVFGLFKRLHRDDTQGLGVGLALCRRLLEQQGGRMWIESELGQGTRVHFTLSAAASAKSGGI